MRSQLSFSYIAIYIYRSYLRMVLYFFQWIQYMYNRECHVYAYLFKSRLNTNRIIDIALLYRILFKVIILQTLWLFELHDKKYHHWPIC
jgi:hypothetical protein